MVHHGVDEPLRDGNNVFYNVYNTMLLQVARDYPGLPDARTLKAREILYFYNGLRDELLKHAG